MRRLFVGTFVALIGIAACQEPLDISAEIDTYADRFNSVVGELCMCPEELGHASSIECDDALGQLGLAERECMATELEGGEDEARGYLECASLAYDDYLACLEHNPGCAEGWNADCASTFGDAEVACGGGREAVIAALGACQSS